MSIWIGLTGASRSGKDTVGDILQRCFGLTKTSFGEVIYLEIARDFNIPIKELHDPSVKESPRVSILGCTNNGFKEYLCSLPRKVFSEYPCITESGNLDAVPSYEVVSTVLLTPRFLLQQRGDYDKQDNPEYIVNTGVQRWHAYLAGGGEIGCVDCSVRFPNEAQAIRKTGGRIIRIHNPFAPKINSHKSETPLPDHLVDLELYNGFSIANLEKIIVPYIKAAQ